MNPKQEKNVIKYEGYICVVSDKLSDFKEYLNDPDKFDWFLIEENLNTSGNNLDILFHVLSVK